MKLTNKFLADSRNTLIDEIRELLPDEQEYVNIYLRYSPGVKYAGKKWSDTGFYEARRDELNPSSWEFMPIEDLVMFRDGLLERKQRHAAKRQ